MEVYTKINTLYQRYQITKSGVEIPNPKWKMFQNKIILGKFADETFKFLFHNDFEAYSKIDGTNSKIVYFPMSETVKVGGKTDNANSQHGQFEFLQNIADRILPLLKEQFPKEDFEMTYLLDGNGKIVVDEGGRVTMTEPEIYIYGEYYGEGVQKGGGYCKGNRFAVFDICVNGWWIPSDMRHEICQTFELEEVPCLGKMSIAVAESMVRGGFRTKVDNVANPDLMEEGLVLRPTVPIKNSRGKRVIVKVKYKDYVEYDSVRKEFTDKEFKEFEEWYNSLEN